MCEMHNFIICKLLFPIRPVYLVRMLVPPLMVMMVMTCQAMNRLQCCLLLLPVLVCLLISVLQHWLLQLPALEYLLMSALQTAVLELWIPMSQSLVAVAHLSAVGSMWLLSGFNYKTFTVSVTSSVSDCIVTCTFGTSPLPVIFVHLGWTMQFCHIS